MTPVHFLAAQFYKYYKILYPLVRAPAALKQEKDNFVRYWVSTHIPHRLQNAQFWFIIEAYWQITSAWAPPF